MQLILIVALAIVRPPAGVAGGPASAGIGNRGSSTLLAATIRPPAGVAAGWFSPAQESVTGDRLYTNATAGIAGTQTPKIQTWEKVISPGLTYRQEVDTDTPLIVNALRFSLNTPGLKAIPQLAGRTINEDGSVKGRLTPTQMVAQDSAIAGINGDFFSFTQGAPIGSMVRNGELLTTPLMARAAFAWGPHQSSIGFCKTTATMTPDGGTTSKIDAVNQPCGANQTVVYTTAEGTAINNAPNVTAVLSLTSPVWAPSTIVTATMEYIIPDAKETKVPDGKALIVATGDKMPALAALKPGQKVTIELKTTGFDWEKTEDVIGGGPILLKDGKVAVDAEQEGFPASFYAKRHPRTALGRTAEGDIWMVTVDGRQEISAGATLDELAKVMLRLGCVDAVNLDGGGSTCMHLLGVTVNRPSDGPERPVSNGVLVMGPKLTAYKGELKLVIPPKISLTANLTAHLTLDGKPAANSDVIWSATGAAWIDQGGNIHPLELGKAKIKAAAYGQVLTLDVTVVERKTARSCLVGPVHSIAREVT